MKKLYFESDRLSHFSIRKYSVGVISLLVGFCLLGLPHQVSADELGETSGTNVVMITSDKENAATKLGENIVDTDKLSETDTRPLVGDVTSEVPYVEANESAVSGSLLEEVPSNSEESTTSLIRESEVSVSGADIAKPISAEDDLLAVEAFLTNSEKREFCEGATSRIGHQIGDDYPVAWKNDPDNPDDWGYAKANCTSFVAHRLYKVNKFTPPRALGNGGQWGDSARSLGYRVDNIPAVGAVAYHQKHYYGHVAWVAAIEGDRLLIEEYNWDLGYGPDHSYHTQWQSASDFSGFIHFKDLSVGSLNSGTLEPTKPSTGNTLPSSGTYRFTERKGIKAAPKISSVDLAYYNAGDTVNYDRTLKADNYEWISYLTYSGSRRYIAINKLKSDTKPTQPSQPSQPNPKTDSLSGRIIIQNKNDSSGTFEVVISDVSSPKGVREVKVPTWATKNGQDDIIWYNANKQSDGTYKVFVDINQHKNYRGEYNVHLYYVQNDGQMVGVTATTTNVGTIVAPQKPAIPNSGTYVFTGRASIKAVPDITAPELAYYAKGNSVNYDKVIFANNHYWLSYLSYAGNRRYISIT